MSTTASTIAAAPGPALAVSPDWGIAIAILVVGIGAIWRWGQAKDKKEDELHAARIAEYQQREAAAIAREDALRDYLRRNSDSMRTLADGQKGVLDELRRLRGTAQEAINTSAQSQGAIQREGAIVMVEARRQYQDLNNAIVVLASKVEALHGRLDERNMRNLPTAPLRSEG